MKLNPAQSKDTYKKQEETRDEMFERVVPVAGTYDVVNVKLQHQKVGKKGTRKLRIITHVLKVQEAKRKEEAAAMVGSTFGQDIWWNFFRDDGSLNFNGQRMNYMALAHGCEEEWDPDDDDELVATITGIPYRIKIDVETRDVKQRGSDKVKTYYDIDVLEAVALPATARKRYTSAPDWKQTLPKEEERMLKRADYSKPAGGDSGGGSGSQAADPFEGGDDGFEDEDLPF